MIYCKIVIYYIAKRLQGFKLSIVQKNPYNIIVSRLTRANKYTDLTVRACDYVLFINKVWGEWHTK